MLFNKNRKLKHFIIFPEFQLTLVAVNLLIMTVCYGLVFYQVYDSFNDLIDIGERLRMSKDSAFFKLLTKHHSLIQSKLILAAVISYVFSFTLTVIVSHRVSGPLYRLKQYFLDLKKDGHTCDLKFRKGDYYSELPDIINQGLQNMEKKD